MNKLLVKKIAVGAAMVAMMLPFAAFGATGDSSGDVFVNDDPLGLNYATATGLATTDVRETVSKLINAFMGLLGIVAVVLILLGGFKWMMAAGNDAKVDEAKKLMVSGVIGLVIVMLSFAIARFVVNAIVTSTTAV